MFLYVFSGKILDILGDFGPKSYLGDFWPEIQKHLEKWMYLNIIVSSGTTGIQYLSISCKLDCYN